MGGSARSDLLQGLALGQLRLAYQPQVDLATGRVMGFEGVARWDHPALGELGPGLFLGLASREGLMPILTRTLAAEAAAQSRAWRDSSLPSMVALNLSSGDLTDPVLAADLLQLVRKAGCEPASLMLEAGEEGLAMAGEAGMEGLERLHAAGFQIALDTRGPPVVALDGRARALFRQIKCGGATILQVARRLRDLSASQFACRLDAALAAGFDVVAVGAETADALEVFRQFGFTRAQGNALAPPLAADACERLMLALDPAAPALRASRPAELPVAAPAPALVSADDALAQVGGTRAVETPEPALDTAAADERPLRLFSLEPLCDDEADAA